LNTPDFILSVPSDRSTILLQLTDTQIIDASQSRTPLRLSHDQQKFWAPENADKNCFCQIRELVKRTSPDLIIITGDIIYGEFDDNGSMHTRFIAFMDSLKIPWSVVFGNHDNETRMGVDWQCAQYENSPYCLFKRGHLTGNTNFTIGLMRDDRIFRIIYMMDDNGCCDSGDPAIVKTYGLAPDQKSWLKKTAKLIGSTYGQIPAFFHFHRI